MVYVKEQAHLVNTPQHPILLYYRSLSLGEASILSGSPSTPPRKALEAEKRSLYSKYVRKEHLLAHHLFNALRKGILVSIEVILRGQAQPTNESQIKSLNSEVHNIHMLKEINHNNGNEEQ